MIERIFFGVAVALSASGACFAQSAAEISKAKAEIWEIEKKIYTYDQRNRGGDYYYNISSKRYLGWVYGTAKPFHKGNAPPKTLKTPTKEVITPYITGFTLVGSTAVLYYTNHRTMQRDGAPTDQYFANIHVFVREGNNWKLLASMSRLEPSAVTTALPQ